MGVTALSSSIVESIGSPVVEVAIMKSAVEPAMKMFIYGAAR